MGLGASIALDGVPDDELSAASTVEVHERAGEPTRFRVRYDIDLGDRDIPQLSAAKFSAGASWSVLVSTPAGQQCLVQGPVHAQRIKFEAGGDGTFLEVIGADSSIELDREAKSMVWDEVTDSEIVKQIVDANYEADIDGTAAQHAQDKHALVQRETDLSLVRRLARRNGFLFWVTADASGVETAHFKRPPAGDAAAVKLTINQPSSSLRSLELRWDVERPTSTSSLQLDLNTKDDIDGSATGSPLDALGELDLAAITQDTRSVFLSAPVDDQGDLSARSEAALIDAAWFVRATCDADLSSVGALVRACTVVELTGAGKRHSGNYFVAAVRHTINPVLHRMELELVRNAWGS